MDVVLHYFVILMLFLMMQIMFICYKLENDQEKEVLFWWWLYKIDCRAANRHFFPDLAYPDLTWGPCRPGWKSKSGLKSGLAGRRDEVSWCSWFFKYFLFYKNSMLKQKTITRDLSNLFSFSRDDIAYELFHYCSTCLIACLWITKW